MKYIYTLAFLFSVAYLMTMPVDEAKPVEFKQVKVDPHKQEWDELFRRAEFMTGFGVR